MSMIPAELRRQAIQRAGNRCEYCGLSQDGQEAAFHVDHIVPRTAGGQTSSENLALACVSCSLRKGDRVLVIDPATGTRECIFNPRRERWSDHFEWVGLTVVGLTPVGRATIAALSLNRTLVQVIRAEERMRGRHPPAQ